MALNFVHGKPVKVKPGEAVPVKKAQVAMPPPPPKQVVVQVNLETGEVKGQEQLQVEKKLAQEQATQYAEPQVQTEEASSEVLSMVDRVTELQEQIDAADVSHLLKEQGEILKQLQLIAKSDNFADKKPVLLYGTHENYVEYSAKSNKQVIANKQGLIEAITLDKYVENTDITLTAAKKLLSETELAQFTAQEAGSRTYKGCHKGK